MLHRACGRHWKAFTADFFMQRRLRFFRAGQLFSSLCSRVELVFHNN
ncbi:hypothetical protein PCH70_05470 [Pseudomonas cichorii JBC1]|nr:hypothetical protein PCH70_05470 [Pseudomonas cichorii JBC1]